MPPWARKQGDCSMSLLIAFKDCAKCGGQNIGVAYHESRRDCLYYNQSAIEQEHLHYNCRTCGYNWSGPTKDAHPYETP